MDPEKTLETMPIESIFVRRRNVLMLRGQFTPLYTDYYLHLMQHGVRYPEHLDSTLKEFLAMLALHLVARPWTETIAWTVNLRAPRANFFANGTSLGQVITGRCFTENVRESPGNQFYQQTKTPRSDSRHSTLEVEGADALDWIETLYEKSEQRPGKAFRLPDETYLLLAAQPDYDPAWLESLDTAAAANIEKREETNLIETRSFRFHCHCTLDRILPILGGWRNQPDELFQGEHEITIECPRCAARYLVTRDMI